VYESGSDFQVRSPGVKKLKGFEETPLVFLHDVGRKGDSGSALSPD